MSKSKSSFALVGVALDTPIRAKKNRAGNLKAAKAKIKRVVEKHPEVMVKVTGGAKGSKHLKAHMDYIGRNGDIELENERGEILDTRERIREEHKQWSKELGQPRKNERDSINIVLSMPKGTDAEAVRRAVRAFAKEQFGETNQYVMALHHPGNDKDTKNPHVHLTVKARGYDGAKLDPRKDDLADWREAFAEKMREQGHDAEATPRRSRGVIEKGQRQAVRSMETKPKRPGSKLQADKLREAADALAGKPVTQNPHRKQIAEKQTEIRKAWISGADELDKSADPEDKALAAKIRQFVKDMPRQLQDEREKLKAKLVAEIAANRKREAGHKAPQQTIHKGQDTDKDKDLGR
jgi:hypothetical protein